MSGTFTCLHCQSRIQVNPRLKNSRQQYCRKKECQKARKRKWQQDRMNNDDDYRTKQLESVKRWQKAKPFHSYMAMYRQDHLEYVEINRKQQAERNLKRRENQANTDEIVKMDALGLSTSETTTYEMIQLKRNRSGKIVKMDTLMVQLKQIQQLSLPFGRKTE